MNTDSKEYEKLVKPTTANKEMKTILELTGRRSQQREDLEAVATSGGAAPQFALKSRFTNWNFCM